jgi:hypothetical protein
MPKTYWLCSAHNILKTNHNMTKYTQENIKHIPLRIGQYRDAVLNNSMKIKSTNNEDSAPKWLKIHPEPKTGPRPIYLMTIQLDNRCQQVRVLLASG